MKILSGTVVKGAVEYEGCKVEKGVCEGCMLRTQRRRRRVN